MNQPSAPEYLKRVNAALALREIPDYEAALEQLKKAVTQAPTDASIHLLLGLTFQDLGQISSAIDHLSQALQNDNQLTTARQALGLLLVQQKQMVEAVDVLEPLIEEDIHDPTVWQAMATAKHSLGEDEDAIAILKKAYERWPQDVMIVNKLGHLLLECDRPDEAAPILEKAIALRPSTGALCDLAMTHVMAKDYEAALAVLDRAIARSPESSRPWRGIAYCHLQLGNLPEAEKAARKALQFNDQHFRSWQILADVLLAAGKREEAFDVIEQGIELAQKAKDGEWVYYNLMGLRAMEILQREGPDAALAQIKGDLQQAPDHLGLWRLQLDIYLAIGKYEPALATIEQLLEKGVPAGELIFERFHTFHGLNRPEAAISVLPPIKDLPVDTQEQILSQMEMVGFRLYDNDRVEAVRSVFDQVLQFAPNRMQTVNNLGFILVGLKHLQEAEACFLKANSTDFEPALVLSNLGYLYICQQRYDEAVVVLQKALSLVTLEDEGVLRIACWHNGMLSSTRQELFPKRPLPVKFVVQLNLATAHMLIGQGDQAIGHAQQAIEMQPERITGYRVLGSVYLALDQKEQARETWEQGMSKEFPIWEKELLSSWLAESFPHHLL